jgi:hypothetical protein
LAPTERATAEPKKNEPGTAGQDESGARQSFVLDRAVASIEGKVITLSQLEFETRVQLINRGGVGAAFAELDREDLSRGLQLAIAQRLSTLEADRFGAYLLDSGEIERALLEFKDRIGGEARFRQFLERYEADAQDVELVLKRAIRAGLALEGRLRLKATVAESDVKRAVSERADLREVPFEVARQVLHRERFERLVQQELTAARKQADVRVLTSFSNGGAP